MVIEHKHKNWYAVFDSCDIARVEEARRYRNDKGETWWKFWFDPEGNDNLKNRYDLKSGEEIDPTNGLVMKEYPAKYVIEAENPLPDRKFWYVFLDFNGGKTTNSNREADLIEENRVLEEANQRLTIKIHKQEAEMYELMDENMKYQKKQNEMREAIRGRPTPQQDISQPPNINR